MNILEMLKRALDLDSADYKNMPDYSDMLDYLGMLETDDPNDVRDAIEAEIDALEADADDGEGGDDVSTEA